MIPSSRGRSPSSNSNKPPSIWSYNDRYFKTKNTEDIEFKEAERILKVINILQHTLSMFLQRSPRSVLWLSFCFLLLVDPCLLSVLPFAFFSKLKKLMGQLLMSIWQILLHWNEGCNIAAQKRHTECSNSVFFVNHFVFSAVKN